MAQYCCGNCEILNLNDCRWGNEYYCKIKGKYLKQSESACSSFCKDKDTREKESHEYHRAGWYIVTVISNILIRNYGNDFGLLESLSKIRYDYLEKEEEFKSVLDSYDLFGPLVAKKIEEDEDNVDLALDLSSHYLIPFSKLVNDGNISVAARLYLNMVEMLKVRFNLISVAITKPMQEEIEKFDTLRRKRG